MLDVNGKKIIILGSTGSIGVNAVDVIIKSNTKFDVIAITANDNISVLKQQIELLNPKYVYFNKKFYSDNKDFLKRSNVEFLDIEEITKLECEINIAAISGNAALKYVYQSSKNCKILAIANKESIVCASKFILNSPAKVIPIDSEHNAVLQVLDNENKDKLRKVILTASGGPFRSYSFDDLKKVTINDALNHPNWSMGKKITIDSATMANKALEMIEAYKLFDLEKDQIDAIIHPESIIHCLVEYMDGSVLAHLGMPDMRIPIAYSIHYPKRIELNNYLDFAKLAKLEFMDISKERFPLIELAKDLIKLDNHKMIIFNVVNELAVNSFLEGKINFIDIFSIINRALDNMEFSEPSSIDDILNIESEIVNKFETIAR